MSAPDDRSRKSACMSICQQGPRASARMLRHPALRKRARPPASAAWLRLCDSSCCSQPLLATLPGCWHTSHWAYICRMRILFPKRYDRRSTYQTLKANWFSAAPPGRTGGQRPSRLVSQITPSSAAESAAEMLRRCPSGLVPRVRVWPQRQQHRSWY